MATVVTSDGVFLNAPDNLVNNCSVLKNIVADCGEPALIPLPNINRVTMEIIIEFCNNGRVDPNCNMLEVLMAADYLGYENLLDYGARVVADSLRGRSAVEIRRYFGITPVS